MNLETLIESTCFAHSKQVSMISALMAESAGYPPGEISAIRQAALYHDIGKSDIPEQILNKPGALTPEEYEIVKTHTARGYSKITDAVNVLSIAADVCRDHHERPDGSGYCGMTDREIHPYSKIISVADVFDALYSRRSYKEAWDMEKIREFFSTQSGKQFDAGFVKLLFAKMGEILALYPNPPEYA